MESNNSGRSGPSWTWIVGALMTVLLFFGAYGWNSIDSRISKAEAKTSELSIASAIHMAQYDEIIRRLNKIEEAIEKLPQPSVRVGAPKTRGFGNEHDGCC